MKTLCALLMTVLLSGCGQPWEGEMASEVQALREKNHAAELDLAPIVVKHIPPGSDKKRIESKLKDQGFELYYSADNDAQSSELLAIRTTNKRFPTLRGINEEIRLIVVFNNDMVRSAKGRLFYRGP